MGAGDKKLENRYKVRLKYSLDLSYNTGTVNIASNSMTLAFIISLIFYDCSTFAPAIT